MAPTPDPDEAEIAERCREIQQRWSADEERRRRKWCVAPPVEVVEAAVVVAVE